MGWRGWAIPARQESTPIHIALLLAIPFTGLLSNALLIPVLPKIAAEIDVPFHLITWLIVLPSIVAGLCIPVAGYLSDRWTRTIILAPSLVLYGLGGLLGAVSPSISAAPFPILLVARFLQGVGYAGTIALVIALAGDILPARQRPQVLGLIETSNAFGKGSGPLIGSALATISWNAPFFIFPAFAFPLAVWLWVSLGRVPKPEVKRPGIVDFGRRFWRTSRSKAVGIGILFLTGFWGVNVILLLLTLSSRELAEAGFRGLARGALITIPEVAVGVAAWGAGRWMKPDLSSRSRPITLTGLALIVAGFAIAALSGSVATLLVGATVAGIGAGAALAAANALVAGSVPDAQRGVVASMYGAFRALGVAIIPLFFALSRLAGGEANGLWLMGGLVTLSAVAVALGLAPDRLLADS